MCKVCTDHPSKDCSTIRCNVHSKIFMPNNCSISFIGKYSTFELCVHSISIIYAWQLLLKIRHYFHKSVKGVEQLARGAEILEKMQ